MEDRLGAGLYLEMCDLPAARYQAERAPTVGALPGVSRTSWWANANPNRDDLPRHLAEFSLLGVSEVDASFVAPAPPAGGLGVHFHRTPRPGQGSLSADETVGLLLVLISPRHEGGAQALRDWADFVHIRHIVEAGVPGFRMITPYENVTGGDPRFLHFYEMAADDPEAAFRAMVPRVIDRIGAPDTEAFRAWASHPELRIMYVNTFRRVGTT